jgi:hypothetical protein
MEEKITTVQTTEQKRAFPDMKPSELIAIISPQERSNSERAGGRANFLGIFGTRELRRLSKTSLRIPVLG